MDPIAEMDLNTLVPIAISETTDTTSFDRSSVAMSTPNTSFNNSNTKTASIGSPAYTSVNNQSTVETTPRHGAPFNEFDESEEEIFDQSKPSGSNTQLIQVRGKSRSGLEETDEKVVGQTKRSEHVPCPCLEILKQIQEGKDLVFCKNNIFIVFFFFQINKNLLLWLAN